MPQSPTNNQHHPAGIARRLALSGVYVSLLSTPANAALLVEYQATDIINIGERLWQYRHTLSGDSLLTDAGFATFFDHLTYIHLDPMSTDAVIGGRPRSGPAQHPTLRQSMTHHYNNPSTGEQTRIDIHENDEELPQC